MTKLNIDTRQLHNDTQRLIKRIKKMKLKKKDTAVVAISRGGLVPAQYVAYALGLKDIYCVRSKLYTKKDKISEVHNVSGLHDIDYDAYTNFLVVDDIYDSGTTLDNILALLYSTSEHSLGKLFNDRLNFFIPCVIYSQKTKEEMVNQGITYGRLVSKVYQDILQKSSKENPWVVFPWDVEGKG